MAGPLKKHRFSKTLSFCNFDFLKSHFRWPGYRKWSKQVFGKVVDKSKTLAGPTKPTKTKLKMLKNDGKTYKTYEIQDLRD